MRQVLPGESRQKVAGGFVLPLAWQLFAAWWCYRSGLMPLRALRVWLALHEVAARRCTLDAKRKPTFRLEELVRLVGGVGGDHVRSDLRRLRGLGLVSFEGGRIHFLESPEQLQGVALDEFWAALERIPNHKRRVPIPRRALRYLAGCSKRVLLATALGEAVRLLYYRGGTVHTRGRCKASWVAEAFQVDLRGAKRARAHLEAIGLLVPVGESCSRERVFERRWGKAVVWNIEWSAVPVQPPGEVPRTATVGETELPPVEAKNDTRLPPVESDDTLLEEQNKNQKPGLPGPAAGSSAKKSGAEKLPSMRDIVEQDLTDDVRSEKLYRDAVKLGMTDASEAAELRFFGLIEHARRYGTKNRPGLLRSLVEKKRYYVTQDDEEGARLRLRRRHADGSRTVSRERAAACKPETGDSRAPVPVGELLAKLLSACGAQR